MTGETGGRYCIMEHPLLVILEAKRSSAMPISSSEVEILGQLRNLMVK
jgi:hypothetical protein